MIQTMLQRALLPLGLLLLAAGCATPQRTIQITSEPAGALVFLNGQEVGRTPMQFDFTWYGDYDVVLRRDGYQTLKTNQPIIAPVHLWPPFDLVSEAAGARDIRRWHFELQPIVDEVVDATALVDRATQLRDELRSSEHTRRPLLPTPEEEQPGADSPPDDQLPNAD